MRIVRANASNTVQAQYRVMAPASIAMADWANFGGSHEVRGPQPVERRAP